MKYVLKPVLISILLTISFNAYSANYLENKTYSVTNNEIPHHKEIVSQHSVKNSESYKKTNAKGWYFCSQAAWASAFNILRTKRDANHAEQLEYFHKKLKAYSAYNKDPHRQGSGDWLSQITNKRSDFKVTKKTTLTRKTIKEYLHKSLISNNHQLPIVVGQNIVNGTKYSHFYVVYKVKYNPSGTSTAYYADPYTGRVGSMDYSKFLNGMRDGGTNGRYSMWIIKKQ